MILVLVIVAAAEFALLAAMADRLCAARREIKRLKRHLKPEQVTGFGIKFEVSQKE